jgi:sigma-B regulation protein RsbU (phosphoserine phosphatase)
MKQEVVKKKTAKLSRRITWRVIGIMVFFNVLIIGVILGFVFKISLINSNMRGQYVVDGIEGKIESMLWAVHIGASHNRDEIERNMESPEQVFDALEREMQVNQCIGSFAAFEPDYFKGEGRWFEAYVYHADSSRIERQQIGSPNHDYFNGVWYKKGFSRDRQDMGYLTALYFDNSVDSAMYCSYVLPIVDHQGRKVGVCGVDLDYRWLNSVIGEVGKIVKREFFDNDESLQDREGNINFSVQIIDNKGNRIFGSDSLDINILQAEQEEVFGHLGMKDLKGTPYYVNFKSLPSTDWTIAVIQHRDLVFAWGQLLALIILLCMGVGCLVIFFFTSRGIRSGTKPLGFLSEAAQEVAKGNFDAALPTFKHNDEVAQLRDSFGTMQQSLKQYVEELKVSTAAKASIESELNVAHNIQMSMIPKTFPAFSNRKDIDLYASLSPAKAVGGDLYDFFIRDEKLFFCIGDVSGKGVPASLVMAVSRTLFRNIAAHTDEPKHIVETMNENIAEGNENCMFVTLFVGVLDLETGRLRYCNAGHEAPFLQDKQLPYESNLPIGVMPNRNYTEQATDMVPGTTLFLYTDGLTEAENAKREQFGRQRIGNVITKFTGSSQQLVETMIAAVHQFVGDTEQSDDLTLLAFKYNKSSVPTDLPLEIS